MKSLFLLLVLTLAGCATSPEPVAYSPYLRVLSENGRPDSVWEDNLGGRRVLVYWDRAYIFSQDGMKLLAVKEKASVVLVTR